MWSGKRETDLIKLLNIPALAAKIFKFLLDTGELLQSKHLNEVVVSDAEDVDLNPNRETPVEDDW